MPIAAYKPYDGVGPAAAQAAIREVKTMRTSKSRFALIGLGLLLTTFVLVPTAAAHEYTCTGAYATCQVFITICTVAHPLSAPPHSCSWEPQCEYVTPFIKLC